VGLELRNWDRVSGGVEMADEAIVCAYVRTYTAALTMSTNLRQTSRVRGVSFATRSGVKNTARTLLPGRRDRIADTHTAMV